MYVRVISEECLNKNYKYINQVFISPKDKIAL